MRPAWRPWRKRPRGRAPDEARSARLARLEALVDVSGADLSRLTDDELSIEILDLARCIAADPEAPADLREDCRRKVVEIEDGIRWQAALGKHPIYAATLERLNKLMLNFVPAIAGHVGRGGSSVEVQDLAKPGVMERRAALRSRCDIKALIAVGASEAVPVTFDEWSGPRVISDGELAQLRRNYPAILLRPDVQALIAEGGAAGHA